MIKNSFQEYFTLLLVHYIIFIGPFIKSIVCAFTQSSLGIFSLFILLIGITSLFLVLLSLRIVEIPNEAIKFCPVRIKVRKICYIFKLNNNNNNNNDNEDNRLQILIIIISFLVIFYGLGLSSPIIYSHTINIAKKNPPGSYTETCKNISFFKAKNKLEADCPNKNGSYINTSLKIPECFKGEVTNCNGNLKRGSCLSLMVNPGQVN